MKLPAIIYVNNNDTSSYDDNLQFNLLNGNMAVHPGGRRDSNPPGQAVLHGRTLGPRGRGGTPNRSWNLSSFAMESS